jgi:hypothetical protein
MKERGGSARGMNMDLYRMKVQNDSTNLEAPVTFG